MRTSPAERTKPWVYAMNSQGEATGFVQRSGHHFVVNGRRALFAGANNYYQMIRRRSGSPGVDEVLDQMAARGMNLLRTWAFQDDAARTWDCLIGAPPAELPAGRRPVDYLSEATLVGLDQTVAACEARDIRVVLTLVNNWDDFGGMNRWTVWRFGRAHHDRFYTDPLLRDWYKELAYTLVHRVNTVSGRIYRDDPTIFAWQLTNEARLTGRAATPAQLDAWFAEMSAYLKSIDPNHMVSTGIEGFYGTTNAARNTDAWMSACGHDFIANHQHATIDYATCHMWPQNWRWNPVRNPAGAMNKAAQFVLQRIEDAGAILGKPFVLEEFGIPRDDLSTGPGGPTLIRDGFFSQVFFPLCEASARTMGAFGASTVWMLLDDHTAAWDDGNGIFLPQDAVTDAILSAHCRYITGTHASGTA